MEIISMEDLLIEMEGLRNQRWKDEGFMGNTERIIKDLAHATAYAKFLKTTLSVEYFHGPEAIVRIKDCDVMGPTLYMLASEVPYDFSISLMHKDEPLGFTMKAAATFKHLIGYPGAELTEHGIKLIFG